MSDNATQPQTAQPDLAALLQTMMQQAPQAQPMQQAPQMLPMQPIAAMQPQVQPFQMQPIAGLPQAAPQPQSISLRIGIPLFDGSTAYGYIQFPVPAAQANPQGIQMLVQAIQQTYPIEVSQPRNNGGWGGGNGGGGYRNNGGGYRNGGYRNNGGYYNNNGGGRQW